MKIKSKGNFYLLLTPRLLL